MHGLVQQTIPISTTTRIDQVSDSAVGPIEVKVPHLHLFLLRACYAVLMFSSRIACYQDVSRRP